MKKVKTLPLIFTILLVLWVFIILLFADFDRAGAYFWTGLVFGIIGFLLGIGAICCFHGKATKTAIEIGVFPMAVSVLYMILSTILNTVYVCIADGDHIKVLILLNVLLIAFFVIAELLIAKPLFRLSEQVEKVDRMTKKSNQLQAKLGTISTLIEDDEVRNYFRKLQETVAYSDNTSKGFGREVEAQFMGELNTLHELMLEKAEKEAIIGQIKKSEQVWLTRNSVR